MPISFADIPPLPGIQTVVKKQVIKSDYDLARALEEAIISEVEAGGFSDVDVFAIRLALEEALVNAIRHGNKLDPHKKVRVEWCVCNGKLEITIEDEGKGFTPNAVPDPTKDENLERPGGRGLMLMKAYMDCVEYNAQGNIVKMCKKINCCGG